MTFTRKNRSIDNNYFLNGQLISRVNSVKDLGVNMDSTLSFNSHIEHCINSASRMMGFIMRQSTNFKNIRSLISLFTSLVRSRLESAVVVWGPVHESHEQSIERVQKKFLRYLFYKCFNVYTYLIPYSDLLEMFELDSLTLRRKVIELVYLWGLVRGRVDDAAAVGALCYRVPNFNSRSKILFSLPQTRTSARAAFPLLRMMRSYNSLLLNDCKLDIHVDSLPIFKNKCLSSLK